MKKRLTLALAAGALVAAMLPGVAQADGGRPDPLGYPNPQCLLRVPAGGTGSILFFVGVPSANPLCEN